jgi:metal-responsive CopG/Arc/MetJ family transcriptional regulator
MSIAGAKKSRRGRPTVDSEAVNVRIDRPLLTELDAYIAEQPEPRPTRPEAIRLALREWLVGLGRLKHRDDPEGANGR